MKNIALIVVVMVVSGCIAGGGGSVHIPPEAPIHNKDLDVDITLSVWGSGSETITQRYSDVEITLNGRSIPMTLVEAHPSRGTWRHVIPANTYKAGEQVSYVITFSFDGHPGSRSGEIKFLTVVAQQGDSKGTPPRGAPDL